MNLLATVAFLAPKDVPEASAKILAGSDQKDSAKIEASGKFKSRGYNIDLRTTTADLNKLVREEIDKYVRFTPQELG